MRIIYTQSRKNNNSKITLQNKSRANKYSKKLKAKATIAELYLKTELEKRNIFFWFQKAAPKGSYRKGFYIPDFTFKIKKEKIISYLYVEVDGEYHNEEKQIIYDRIRTKKLEKKYKNKVLRFTNEEVIKNSEKIINEILKYEIWNPSISLAKKKHADIKALDSDYK